MTATHGLSAPRPGWDCHAHIFDGRPVLRVGHYEPPLRDLASLEQEARALDVGHAVLVQPSVYGTDNGLLLAALRDSGGAHRGIVVVDDTVSDGAMHGMQAMGVRGVRFNLVSPAGNDSEALERLAPRLRDHGWHVQWYATPGSLQMIAELHERLGLRCVLDHVGGFTRSLAGDAALWKRLRHLADMGAWIKLSGWYRLGASAPYESLDAMIARVAALFGAHCVWGSDWPHTHFLELGNREPMPSYVDAWRPVLRALGNEHAQRILCEYPRSLYE
jgi:predicted TIM-barrel fold metal-dependent hydrolase